MRKSLSLGKNGRYTTSSRHVAIVTARKRSLGQGNVFIGVYSQTSGGGLCMMSLPVWLPGPMFLLGGSRSLVPCPGGLCSGGLCQ